MPKAAVAADESTLVNPWPKRVVVRRGPNVAAKPSKDKEPLDARVKALLSREPKFDVDLRPELTALRRRLAEAPEADHDAARDAARAFRKKPYLTRVACSFLFPSEREWVEADIADYAAESKKAVKKVGGGSKGIWAENQLRLLLASLASLDDFLAINKVKALPEDGPHAILVSPHDVYLGRWGTNYLATFLDGFGAGVLPLLTFWFDYVSNAELARAMAAIPTDEAMTALVDRADDKHGMAGLTEAVAAFPERAARILGERVASKGKNHTLVAPMIPKGASANGASAKGTKDAPKAAAKGLVMTAEATAADLPLVLTKPWWLEPAKKKPNTVASGLSPLPFEEKMSMTDEERDRIREDFRGKRDYVVQHWVKGVPLDGTPAEIDAFIVAANEAQMSQYKRFVLYPGAWIDLMSDEGALTWLRANDITRASPATDHLAYLLARFGLDVFEMVLRHGKQPGVEYADVLQRNGAEAALYVESPRSAAYIATVAQGTKGKKLQPQMAAYFERCPEASAIGVLPLVLAKATQKSLLPAFKMLVGEDRDRIVLDVAKRYGDEAYAATRALIDTVRAPKAPPEIPSWLEVAKLPKVMLRTGNALPEAATKHLVTLLGISDARRPAPGLDDVKAACTPESLEAFAWELFEAWLRAGANAKDDWAMLGLGHLGGDGAARKFAALVRAWPGESAHQRAVKGLDALAQIGTDLSIMLLDGIAEKVKFKGLQEKAREKIEQVAKDRKLSREELADRIAPTLDLEEDGSRVLSFGSRSFRVGFDEHLVPFVSDEAGKRLGDLPKPKASDDAAVAKASTDAWKQLKKDAKTVANGQILRLERAMCSQRRWTGVEFKTLLVAHPLVVHLVRRLLWGTFDGPKVKGLFRVAEDRTFADADDGAFLVADDATIGLVHRLEIDEAQAERWGQIFGDYELLQPFPQLARETFAPKSEEVSATTLKVTQEDVPTRKILALEARGWRKGSPKDSGWVWDMKKQIGDLVVEVELEGGLCIPEMSESPPAQKLGKAIVQRKGERRPLAMSELPPLVFSEVVRDLDGLVGE